MLIHQRAFGKYHSPGLWTNACCGHPNKGEEIKQACFYKIEIDLFFIGCHFFYKLPLKHLRVGHQLTNIQTLK